MVRCCHSYVYPAAGPSVFLFMQDTQNHFRFLLEFYDFLWLYYITCIFFNPIHIRL